VEKEAWIFCFFRLIVSTRCAEPGGADHLKTEAVSLEPPLRTGTLASSRRADGLTRREKVNIVVTAVLLAGLVCLLIVGGNAGRPDEPRESPREPWATTEPSPTTGTDRPASDPGAPARS
jgi:hypothetical protein